MIGYEKRVLHKILCRTLLCVGMIYSCFLRLSTSRTAAYRRVDWWM